MKAKNLKEIRLLPPLAISRLGNSPEPVNNYDLVVPEDQPPNRLGPLEVGHRLPETLDGLFRVI